MKQRLTIDRILSHLVLTLGGLLMLVPFFWLVSSSLKEPFNIYTFPPQWIPNPIKWQNYVEVFEAVTVWRYTLNSLFITILGTLGTVLSSSLAAYSFARLRFKGRDLVFGTVLATVMLPFVVTMIPLYILFSRLGWVGTFLPLTVPEWFGGRINILLLRQFFRTIPMELEDAARIDGAAVGGAALNGRQRSCVPRGSIRWTSRRERARLVRPRRCQDTFRAGFPRWSLPRRDSGSRPPRPRIPRPRASSHRSPDSRPAP